MPTNDDLALISLLVSIAAILIAIWARANQNSREETKLRRDVLRRIMGYAYRLTEGSHQLDGEPFTALNEALIVFNDYPKTKELLRKFHNELDTPDRFATNYLELIEEMGKNAGISIELGDSSILKKPFGPKKPDYVLPASGVIIATDETAS